MLSITVPRFFKHLFVLIALFGPIGHTTAYGQASTVALVTTTSAHGETDCEGMSLQSGIAKSMPCRNLPFDCVGKLGCLQTSLLPNRAVPPPRLIVWQTIHYSGVVIPATGLTVKPEVFPPIV